MTSTSEITTNYHRQANKVVIWCFSILICTWGNTGNTWTTKTLIKYILLLGGKYLWMVRRKWIKPDLLVYFVLTFLATSDGTISCLSTSINILPQDHYPRHLRTKKHFSYWYVYNKTSKRSATPTTDKHHSTEGHTIIPTCEARLHSTTKLRPNARWIHKWDHPQTGICSFSPAFNKICLSE